VRIISKTAAALGVNSGVDGVPEPAWRVTEASCVLFRVFFSRSRRIESCLSGVSFANGAAKRTSAYASIARTAATYAGRNGQIAGERPVDVPDHVGLLRTGP